LTFDLLTLKVVSESRVTWAANFSLPRPLCCRLMLDVSYATDRQMSDRRQTSIIA